MSILSQNLKLIRKEVPCTQTEMAEALGIGFRTYVRYESGERDAPAGILILVSKIGNVSLQNLLTRPLNAHDIAPDRASASRAHVPIIKSLNLEEGTIGFQKTSGRYLISMGDAEKKLLAGFRKLDSKDQKSFLQKIKKDFKAGNGKKAGKNKGSSVRSGGNTPDAELVSAAAIKPGRIKKRGQAGSKKLDRKTLREKVSRLKSISRSAPKVTVR